MKIKETLEHLANAYVKEDNKDAKKDHRRVAYKYVFMTVDPQHRQDFIDYYEDQIFVQDRELYLKKTRKK